MWVREAPEVKHTMQCLSPLNKLTGRASSKLSPDMKAVILYAARRAKKEELFGDIMLNTPLSPRLLLTRTQTMVTCTRHAYLEPATTGE